MKKHREFEAWTALILLILSIFTFNPLWAIASGMFVIAVDV